MLSSKKGAKKHCCYGVCRSDTRNKSFLANQYFFVSFRKPCLEYRQKRIKTTVKNHINTCSKCSKCDLWVKRCGRGDGRFQGIDHVNKDTYICSLHFEGESGPTTEYPDPISCVQGQSSQKMKIITRTSLAEKYKEIKDNSDNSTGVSNSSAEDMECENGAVDVGTIENIVIDSSNENVTLTVNSNSCNVNDTFMSTAPSDNCESLVTELNAEDKILSHNLCDQYVQTDIKKYTSKRIQVSVRQVSAMDRFEEFLKSNIKKSKFYTSLAYEEIVILYNFVKTDSKSITNKSNEEKKSNNKDHTKLTPIQQLILVLIRLRVGLLVEDLAYRFEISTTLVSKTIKFWIQHLFDEFSRNLKPFMFPSREKIAETLPKTFKSLKNIRVIVDCTEFQCQSPSNFEHQGNLYSSYKARTTYKALIGCTPNGGVCFVSDVYEGSISDREIFIKSNIADHLEPGDLVLADRGFTVHDIVESKQAYLNIPPFLNGRQRLSSQEEMETKRIAKQRIYVEHVIGRIKQFRLLQKVLSLSLRSSMSQILFVCACLVNFQPAIIID
ncbi:uncharacterized protein LOC141531636 [Cotesia typhae]|uniref:uncharacterized protein LOC141531636 n=1 Tax=Cotesia typhae TaxID=2053667 RepID=UPI003D68E51C